MKFSQNLPIEAVIPDIKDSLSAGSNVVLEAPPGAGKTTIVPLALMDESWLRGKRIVMLEPRRLAARAAARRMSYLLGEDVGKTVGYRTRLDSKTGPLTRIEVVTEGILTRFLQKDPSLTDVGLIIFDEFHERSVHADLGLALAIESRSVREDLRILVMSATLDGSDVSTLLDGARVIKSMGRAFPVEVRYLEASSPRRFEEPAGPAFISKVIDAVLKILKGEDGSILVFLPGSGEIRRTEAGLFDRLPSNVDVCPLYGELPGELQDQALRPTPTGRRKVVLATSIAETSLTIDGIRVVIDGGLKRVSSFSPSIGMSRLETIRVTRDSAEQRAGRAGRLEPGICYRLWDKRENNALRQKNTPEIMEADLAPLALDLAVWGVKDPLKLRWLDPPPDGAMSHAREVLMRLGAMDPDWNATAHGREISKLPLHPRLAHMALKGKDLGLGDLACYLSALLSERDFLRIGSDGRDSDIRNRLEILIGHSARSNMDFDKNSCERVKAAARQLKKTFGIRASSDDLDKAGLLLALAFPDRIGRRRLDAEGRYLLSNGRGAYFRGKDALSKEDYIVAASIDGGDKESQIFLAAPVKLTELEEYFAQDIIDSQTIAWDQAQGAVIARTQRKLWRLVLSDTPIQKPDGKSLTEALLEGIRQNGLGILPWDNTAENLKARINLLNRISGTTGIVFPDVSDKGLLQTIDVWLAPWLDGITRLEHLKRLDMSAVISSLLNRDERQALERLAPTHLAVPSGSRVRIDYTGGDRPILAVRIQEMLGLNKTPAIAKGKVTLLLHLLSPAGRPVQVTEDLEGFWANSYPMVKKEMKGRYPKHYWPDDPEKAQATKGVKKKGIR